MRRCLCGLGPGEGVVGFALSMLHLACWILGRSCGIGSFLIVYKCARDHASPDRPTRSRTGNRTSQWCFQKHFSRHVVLSTKCSGVKAQTNPSTSCQGNP